MLGISKIFTQAVTIGKLKKELKTKEAQMRSLEQLNEQLFSEIARRDQKIIEQQKRMRFFGIQIGNEEYEAEKLDFPSTIKL